MPANIDGELADCTVEVLTNVVYLQYCHTASSIASQAALTTFSADSIARKAQAASTNQWQRCLEEP